LSRKYPAWSGFFYAVNGMPYTTANPPDTVKNLPKKAQELYIEAFNAVLETGGSEEEARKAGWANVKREYKKSGEEWVEKSAGPGEGSGEMAVELKNIDVQFISLVRKGANKKHIIVKSPDFNNEDATFSRVIRIDKIDEPKRMIYGLVYAPDEIDTDGEYATVEEIEKACEHFMKGGLTPNVDLAHSWQKDDGAFIRESWIVKDRDPFFREVGAWAVGIKIEKDELWEQVEKGEIAGLSLGGFAEKVEKARGEGQGVGGERQGDGGADICVCPSCGATAPHEKGKTCQSTKCPECGAAMEGADMKEKEAENLSFMAKLGEAIRNVVQKESASFEEVVDANQFWTMFYALELSCGQIIADEELDHKGRMAKIAESLDQFKKQFATLKTEKMDASLLEKEGKVFSKANYEKLVGMMETLQKLVGAAETEKSTKEEKQMDQEKALKELAERVEKLEKGPEGAPETPAATEPTETEKALKDFQERLEKLEKPAEETPAVAPEVEAIQKSLGEISERLEKLEKPEGEATEKSAEIQAIEKSLAEIGTRLEKVEKARGVSQKGEPEPETAAAPKGPMTGQVSPRVKHFGC